MSKRKVTSVRRPALDPSTPMATAGSWKSAVNQETRIMLPSNQVIRVRILSMADLAYLGHIQLQLVADVMRTAVVLESPVQKDSKGSVSFAWEKVSEDDLLRMLDLFRRVACAAVIEPLVTDDPNVPDAMYVKEIPFEDLAQIFTAAVKEGGASGLGFFHK